MTCLVMVNGCAGGVDHDCSVALAQPANSPSACRFAPDFDYCMTGLMKVEEGYTHGERQIGKSTYPDDGIQLRHSHLLGTLNSLRNLLLVLEGKRRKIMST